MHRRLKTYETNDALHTIYSYSTRPHSHQKRVDPSLDGPMQAPLTVVDVHRLPRSISQPLHSFSHPFRADFGPSGCLWEQSRGQLLKELISEALPVEEVLRLRVLDVLALGAQGLRNVTRFRDGDEGIIQGMKLQKEACRHAKWPWIITQRIYKVIVLSSPVSKG